MHNEIKIISLNVRGLRDYNKWKIMYKYFQEKRADIILLQETHTDAGTIQNWQQEWGSKWYTSHGETNARGVSILIKNNFWNKMENIEIKQDNCGRLITCSFEIADETFLICNFYGPNSDDTSTILLLSKILTEYDGSHIIVGGDFNFVLDSKMDSKNRQVSHKSSSKILDTCIKDFALYDIWTCLHPDCSHFTWYNLRDKIFSRLDFFLISGSLMTSTIEATIIPSIKTDHSCITLALKLSSMERGPGIWKLNVLHLSNPNFVDTINNRITELIKETHKSETLNPSSRWDFIKFEIIQICRKLSNNKARIKNKLKENINKALDTLNKEISDTCLPTTVTTIKEAIDHLTSQLDNINSLELQSNIFRSKALWAKDGEKNSKYFFGLEKRNYKMKNMTCIQKGIGY